VEVLESYEDMKEDLQEMRTGLEMSSKVMNKLNEREKHREREKKQLERDREIKEEQKIWSLRRRQERELTRGRRKQDHGWVRQEDEGGKEDQNVNVKADLQEMRKSVESCQRAIHELNERERRREEEREREKKRLERDESLDSETVRSNRRQDHGLIKQEHKGGKENQSSVSVVSDQDRLSPRSSPPPRAAPSREGSRQRSISPPKSIKKEIPSADLHHMERSDPLLLFFSSQCLSLAIVGT
jgi:hypothetical protein